MGDASFNILPGAYPLGNPYSIPGLLAVRIESIAMEVAIPCEKRITISFTSLLNTEVLQHFLQ